ncbi:MAG: L,D-transpeptidase family protein [Lachnospiraceae bacterium]
MKIFRKSICVLFCIILTVHLLEIEVMAEDICVVEDADNSTEEEKKEEVHSGKNEDSIEISENTEYSNENSEEDKDVNSDEDIEDGEKSDTVNDSKSVLLDIESVYISELKATEENKDIVKLNWKVEDPEKSITGFEIALYTDELLVNQVEGFEQTIEREQITNDYAEAIVNGLSSGVLYYIKVTPYSIDENGIKFEKKYEVVKILILDTSVLKASVAEGTVNLSWSNVDGAEYYDVYQVNGTNRILLGTVVKKTTFTHKVTKNNVTYSYVVSARAESAKSEDSNVISAKPRTDKPGKVSSFSGIDGEKRAVLTWSKVTKATSYYVYRYNSSKKKWELIKNVTGTTYTDKNLKTKKTYKYRIKAVRTVLGDSVAGDATSTLSVSIKSTPGTKVCPMNYKAIIKSKAPCFTAKNSTKRVKYLNPGTKVTTIDYGNGRYLAKLSNGKTYWVSKDRLRFTASIWTTKDYSTVTKTNFVNSKGYKSPTKYLIWISQYTQRVIIYQGSKGKWKVIRSCRCATGTYLHMTPKGVHKITYKEKGWFYKTTYEKPIVHFKDANSFHSRIKNYKGGYADATIGRPKSKGCVRLYDEDINFIYKKCPIGTTVVSY